MTAARDHSVIMQGPQVLSILGGRKDVTRRPCKLPGVAVDRWSRVRPGDRLWVREAHVLLPVCCWPDLPHRSHTVEQRVEWAFYRAGFDRAGLHGWRSPLYLPRWACRIELDVVSIRREKLSEIHADGEREFHREGIPSMHRFRDGWNKMHRSPLSWADDPDVWRIEFRIAG